jgi:hypothetical protein
MAGYKAGRRCGRGHQSITFYFTIGMYTNQTNMETITATREISIESKKQRLMQAITHVWPRLPQTFTGNQLALAVMRQAHIHDVYYDTIFRYMREMKDAGVLNYKVTNKAGSEYTKTEEYYV